MCKARKLQAVWFDWSDKALLKSCEATVVDQENIKKNKAVNELRRVTALKNIPSENRKKERVFFGEGLLKIFFFLPQIKHNPELKIMRRIGRSIILLHFVRKSLQDGVWFSGSFVSRCSFYAEAPSIKDDETSV